METIDFKSLGKKIADEEICSEKRIKQKIAKENLRKKYENL